MGSFCVGWNRFGASSWIGRVGAAAMSHDDEAVKEALEWADSVVIHTPGIGGPGHYKPQILADALREAQAETIETRAVLRREIDKYVEKYEATETANHPGHCLKGCLLCRAEAAEARAKDLNAENDMYCVKFLAASLESRELREALDDAREEFIERYNRDHHGKAIIAQIDALLSRPSPNAERAENVLRVVEASRNVLPREPARSMLVKTGPINGFARGMILLITALASLDSRSEGA